MAKYICEKGEFKCRHCGTVYQYSDLRDRCEGRPYYMKEPDPRRDILDHLALEEGDRVLCTMYVGDDYSRTRKPGIHLVWGWSHVREKRIVPGNFQWMGNRYYHFAEYKVGDADADDLLGDHWTISGIYNGGCCSYAGAIGPWHVWSLKVVQSIKPEYNESNWTEYVTAQCAGPRDEQTLRRLYDEGYDIRLPDTVR